jgi:LacI family transcriptional regulator
MHEAGLAVPEGGVIHVQFDSAGGHAAFAKLLARPQRPTAVFVTSDLMAIGGLSAASSAGVRVPQQLSVVGFDDIGAASYAAPPLTTVATPKREMARRAIGQLIERIRGGREPLRRIALAASLVVRHSTAPAY